jgi:putative DNA primase/helicase
MIPSPTPRGQDPPRAFTGKQRFQGDFTCPICGGSDNDPRGQGSRCFGFLSDDGEWAHCTREEHAGQCKFAPGSSTYAHKMKGQCRCGVEHAPADPKPRKPGRGEVDVAYDYHDADGRLLFQVVRLRPKGFRQRQPKEGGGWVNNVQGVTPVLYRLPALLKADPAALLLVVEGEKDSDKLRALGFIATTNAGGAGKWKPAYSEPLRGRNVVILPDNDDVGREHAQQVARSLQGKAATAKVVELPGLPDHGDVSDWLAGGGTQEALLGLIEAAPLWSKPLPIPSVNGNGRHGPPIEPQVDDDGVQPHEAPDDPHRLARLYLDSHCKHPDGLTLRVWQGEFLHWHGSYRGVAEKEINAALNGLAKEEFDRLNVAEIRAWADRGERDEQGRSSPKPVARKVSASLVGNINQALASYATIKGDVRQPSWLSGASPFPADEILPTRNALVHLPRFIAGEGESAIRPPTPAFFSPYHLDYDFHIRAPEPCNWFKFLCSIWLGDPESIATLREWFGLMLTPDTSHQKIAMLIGPKRSGKGTIARVLRAMIGPENLANPTLASLGTNFGLAPLIGKPAAVITDARLSGRTDVAQVVERLLSISGEDGQTIDRKHREAVTVKLATRFTVISNELPRFTDSSGALASRMIVFRLQESFYGREDRGLERKLLAELPGILLWSIEGWKRLRDRGHFIQPESGKPLVEELEELASPVGMFVKELCEVAPGESVPVKNLFSAWQDWCKEKKREHVGDESSFSRNLRAVVPSLATKPGKKDGVYFREFHGIRLNLSI